MAPRGNVSESKRDYQRVTDYLLEAIEELNQCPKDRKDSASHATELAARLNASSMRFANEIGVAEEGGDAEDIGNKPLPSGKEEEEEAEEMPTADDAEDIGNKRLPAGEEEAKLSLTDALEGATYIDAEKTAHEFGTIARRNDESGNRPICVYFADKTCFGGGSNESTTRAIGRWLETNTADVLMLVCITDGGDIDTPWHGSYAPDDGGQKLARAYCYATKMEAVAVPSLAVIGAEAGEYFVVKMNALDGNGWISYDPLSVNDVLASVTYISPWGWRDEAKTHSRSFGEIAVGEISVGEIAGREQTQPPLRPICLYFASVKENYEAKANNSYNDSCAATHQILKAYAGRDLAGACDFEVVLVNTDEPDPATGIFDGEPSDADMPWPAVDYTYVTGDAGSVLWLRRAYAALYGAVPAAPALVVLTADANGGRSYVVTNASALTLNDDGRYVLGEGPWRSG